MPLPLKTRDPAKYDTIHRAVNAAQEKARLGGTTQDLGTAAVTTADVLGALDDDVAAARHAGELPGGNPLDRITNTEIRESLEDSLASTETLFARIDLPIPDLTVLRDQYDNQVDLPRLASIYEQMETEGKEPMFVLAPVMTKDEAIALYDSMTPERDDKGNITTNAPGMPANNPLRRRNGGNGLSIYKEITDHIWNHLHDQTSNPLTNPDGTKSPIYTDGNGRHWSLRVIQGTRVTDSPDVSHASQPHGHPSISEYLTLQGVRILQGNEPVDKVICYSWLSGTNQEGSYAPCGSGNAGLGNVRVGWAHIKNENVLLGGRSSVG